VKKVILALGLGALAACSDATSPVNTATPNLKTRATLATGDNVATVKEADVTRQVEDTPPTDSWVLYTRASTTGSASFVVGPAATPPSGHGSLQLSTPDGSAKVFLFNYDESGTKLADIDSIAYDTYRSAGSAQQVTSLNIQVDPNGPDVAGGFTTLVFEPVYNTIQGAVVNDAWQHWNAFNGGDAIWWSSRAIPGVCATECYVSWNTIVANNPDATILAFGINQGSGNGGLTTSVDALVLGVSGNSITYDFEDSACHFTTNGSNYNLDGDCVTTSTIIIPPGLTLNGNGHTITANDPAGDHFRGAVVTNGGTTNSVTNVTITAAGLSNVCDGGTDRLRGILFDGANGSITNSTVAGVRQGLSGCQEGNAIEVRNQPFSESGPISVGPDVNVTISGNTVSNYQKNGITVNGAVVANVFGNTVTGDGPADYIAQNGIQIGYGATATVKSNTASGNFYTSPATEACGLLLYRADGVKSSANKFFGNQVNQCNYGKGGGNVEASN